jgi:hypothetical protein
MIPLKPLWTEVFKGIVGRRTLGVAVAERQLEEGYRKIEV